MSIEIVKKSASDKKEYSFIKCEDSVKILQNDWKFEQAKNFCRNKKCPFYNGLNYGCKQNSDAKRCAARMYY